MDTWVASTLWPLWTITPNMACRRSLPLRPMWFSWCIQCSCNRMVILRLTFWGIRTVFPQHLYHFFILTSNERVQFTYIFTQNIFLCSFYFLRYNGHLLGMKWYITVALNCIYLMTHDVEHLFTHTDCLFLFSLKMSHSVLCPFFIGLFDVMVVCATL